MVVYKFDAVIRVNSVNPTINILTQPFIWTQHFNGYSRYTDLKQIEFNKLEIQQNSLAANYIGVSTARTALLSAEFVVSLEGLLKLYFHVNQDTVDYVVGTGSAQNFQQYNNGIDSTNIGFLT